MRTLTSLIIPVILSAGLIAADCTPAPIFADHMVLQRGMPVPVWGVSAPGKSVTVTFRAQEKSTLADANGNWRVVLEPLEAGGPDILKINTQTMKDVLVGEVWIGAGQSNMGVRTGGVMKTDPVLSEMAASSHPTLRIGTARGNWRESNATTNPSLSALPFAFAVQLQKTLNVPVGVIVGSVGGSSTEFWLTPEHLQSDAACSKSIQTYARDVYPNLKSRFEADYKLWEQRSAAGEKRNAPLPPAEPGKTAQAHHIIGKLFEEHIRPAVPMAVRGVLWDQGENVSAVAGPSQHEVMHALITGWRKDFEQPALPWIYIQKPSGGGCAYDPANPLNLQAMSFAPLPENLPSEKEGAYRETFIRLRQIPNTALVITSDLCPGLHPPVKSSYGIRAARAAGALVYGQKDEIYGPMYASHAVEGSTIRVTFTHVGQGLVARHSDELQGFQIAGENGRFVWANAKIDGVSVVVFSDRVPKPVAVRYAWSAQHPWANLFNKNGLPAQTFRTDSK